MDKQRLLFERLAEIKDYWVNASSEKLVDKSDLVWSDVESSYQILKQKLSSQEEREAYEKITDNIVEGVIHSILVMIDGGDDLADKFTVDLIVDNTKESLKNNGALHEGFYDYLLDVEED
ncbi:hypothetical protein SAMN05421736_1582 [Evansella caseinilytica]|uniref:Uncharacterized protein n=1 Tax=Evansella caseinilytica TaxID=1503961 RepID=A0A1H3V3L0_9BACI|nr:histidine kinase [Evansella caseinilytica]SDZ69244.1 hypothetical protein SAMN05421736_1582 [Evansella caseinilytica]